ncbi:MAG: sigma-70 family RNA polymerase sigma factor [Verrucomicrobiota bacterium]
MSQVSREAFSKLIHEHQSSLRSYIRSLGVRLAWVDDIAQETFILAYKKQDSYNEDSDYGAWLRGIARNLVMNEISKSARRRRLLDQRIPEIVSAHEDSNEVISLDDKEFNAQRQDALQACLQKLSERARIIIEARYFREQTSDMIGKDLAMKATAVRKALFSARKVLARCISNALAHPSS